MLDSCDSKYDYLELKKNFVNTLNKHVSEKIKVF